MTNPYPDQISQPLSGIPSGGIAALGILSIIYAVLFKLCGSLAGLSFPLWGPAFFGFLEAKLPDAPPFGTLLEGPTMWYIIIGSLTSLVLGVCFLAGGIGLLKLRAWGRKLLIAASVAKIVWSIMNFLVGHIFMPPWVFEMGEQHGHGGAHGVDQVLGTITGMATNLGLPVVLWVFLTRPSIMAQFEPPSDHAT